MDSMEWDKKTVLKFIEEFKSKPALWDETHPSFRNKVAKRNCYQEIAKVFGISESCVKMKIIILRKQFKRQFQRKIQALQNGYEYESVWYAYNPLSFLSEEGISRRSLNESHFSSKALNGNSNAKSHSTNNGARRFKTDSSLSHVLDSMADRLKPQTRASVFGQNIAMELEELDPLQRIIAEKLISEILFFGKLNQLTATAGISLSSAQEGGRRQLESVELLQVVEEELGPDIGDISQEINSHI